MNFDAPTPIEPKSRWTSQKRRAAGRCVLGLVQMGGSVASLLLIWLHGLDRVSLTVVLATCLATTVSVLVFGENRSRDRPTGNDSNPPRVRE